MAFIEPMHRNKPNITYLLTLPLNAIITYFECLKLKSLSMGRDKTLFTYLTLIPPKLCTFHFPYIDGQIRSVTHHSHNKQMDPCEIRNASSTTPLEPSLVK